MDAKCKHIKLRIPADALSAALAPPSTSLPDPPSVILLPLPRMSFPPDPDPEPAAFLAAGAGETTGAGAAALAFDDFFLLAFEAPRLALTRDSDGSP